MPRNNSFVRSLVLLVGVFIIAFLLINVGGLDGRTAFAARTSITSTSDETGSSVVSNMDHGLDNLLLDADHPDSEFNCHVSGSNDGGLEHDGLCSSPEEMEDSLFETSTSQEFYSKYSYTDSTQSLSFDGISQLAVLGAVQQADGFCDYYGDGVIFVIDATKTKSEPYDQMAAARIPYTAFAKVYGVCQLIDTTGDTDATQSDGPTAIDSIATTDS